MSEDDYRTLCAANAFCDHAFKTAETADLQGLLEIRSKAWDIMQTMRTLSPCQVVHMQSEVARCLFKFAQARLSKGWQP